MGLFHFHCGVITNHVAMNILIHALYSLCACVFLLDIYLVMKVLVKNIHMFNWRRQFQSSDWTNIMQHRRLGLFLFLFMIIQITQQHSLKRLFSVHSSNQVPIFVWVCFCVLFCFGFYFLIILHWKIIDFIKFKTIYITIVNKNLATYKVEIILHREICAEFHEVSKKLYVTNWPTFLCRNSPRSNVLGIKSSLMENSAKMINESITVLVFI